VISDVLYGIITTRSNVMTYIVEHIGRHAFHPHLTCSHTVLHNLCVSVSPVEVLHAPVKRSNRMQQKLLEYTTDRNPEWPITGHILDPVSFTSLCRTHVHKHTCTYTCKHTHTHVRAHTHTYTYTHIHAHFCTHAHTLTRTDMHTHTHAHTHTRTRAHSHAHTHIYTYTRTHTHKHTLTHTHTHIRTYTDKHTHARKHTHTPQTRTHTRTYTHMHPHIQTHTHTYSRIHTNTNTLSNTRKTHVPYIISLVYL